MRTILVIDSDPEFRRMLADFLEAKNFQVARAISGNEGMKTIEQNTPDLVLISRELLQPNGTVGPDGLRILKTLKLDKKYKSIPVILMSSEATEKDIERYRKLRFTAEDYVTKPFEDSDLLRRVENLIGFDEEDNAEAVRSAVDEVMDEDNISSIFNADREELGLTTSAATRRELSELMKQVGAEMERHEQALKWEMPPPKEDEVRGLKEELEAAKQRLQEESERSGEMRERWKKALLVIDGRLKKSQEREERFREDLENMRRRFADVELDHTMELERVQAEKRRIEDELQGLKRRTSEDRKGMPPLLLKELRRAVKMLNRILENLD